MNAIQNNEERTAGPRPAHRPSRSRRSGRWNGHRVSYWAAVATVLAVPVNCVAVVIGFIALRNQLQNLKAVADRTEAQILRSQMRIAGPIDGSMVGPTGEICGFTPYPNKAHYLVVTARGGDFVQDGPVRLSREGLWSGQARFGNAGVGEGDLFIVRLAATQAPISPGMTTLPSDTIFSEPITLRRL